MRRGLLLSFLLHITLVLFFVFNVSHMILPEDEVTFINVKLVTSPDAARTPKPKPVKPVKTQQSSAPKEAPKPEKKKVKAPKHDTKIVDTNKSKIKQKVEAKKEPAKQELAEPKEKPISRPPKLDKTPNKKNLMAENGKPTKEIADDDFLQALDFIEDLQDKESALAIDDEATDATVFNETQKDVALVKRHIEKNWYRPPGIPKLNELRVIIMVKVNRDGTISSMDVVHSSDLPFFDNSILRAVRKSVPLPIPDDKYDVFKTIQLSFNG